MKQPIIKSQKILIFNDLTVKVLKKKGLKNLYLRVRDNGEVEISSPIRVSQDFLIKFIQEKKALINKMQERVKAKNQKQKFENGEVIYLWGQPYYLSIKIDNAIKKPELIKYDNQLFNNQILMIIPEDFNTEARQNLLNKWYKKELTIKLNELSQKFQELTALTAKEWRIRDMKTRWGSCNIKKARIWINLQLTKKPLICLEYVIIHELCHLIEKYHNPRFYALVEKFYPQWREAEKLLKV